MVAGPSLLGKNPHSMLFTAGRTAYRVSFQEPGHTMDSTSGFDALCDFHRVALHTRVFVSPLHRISTGGHQNLSWTEGDEVERQTLVRLGLVLDFQKSESTFS